MPDYHVTIHTDHCLGQYEGVESAQLAQQRVHAFLERIHNKGRVLSNAISWVIDAPAVQVRKEISEAFLVTAHTTYRVSGNNPLEAQKRAETHMAQLHTANSAHVPPFRLDMPREIPA